MRINNQFLVCEAWIVLHVEIVHTLEVDLWNGVSGQGFLFNRD